MILWFMTLTQVFATSLPTSPNLKPLHLSAVGIGREFTLSAKVLLPSDHKLNRQAPSAIDIYQKGPDGWEKLDTVDLKAVFPMGNPLSLSKKISLKFEDSPIAVDSTLFHCDFKGTHCVIESFQGIAKRDSKQSPLLTVNIEGSRP